MPAYDEERHIGAVLDGLPTRFEDHEIIVVVVDDGSSDRTAEIARKSGAEVIELGLNQGKGQALRIGMKALAAHDPVATVWMDADGQHEGAALGALVAPVLAGASVLTRGDRSTRVGRRRIRVRIGVVF